MSETVHTSDSRQEASYWRYWGKAKPSADVDAQYHLLPYHCLDVAAVGWILLDPNQPLVQSLALQLKVKPEWLRAWFVFCLLLHDIGKFFRAFQNLVPDLSKNLVPYRAEFVYAKRHDTLGFLFWTKLLSKTLVDIIPAEYSRVMSQWLEIACGHHGYPPEKGLATIRPYLMEQDQLAAEQFIRDCAEEWLPDLEPLLAIGKQDYKRASWQLAGIAVLADWLGSNQNIFEYVDVNMPLAAYWDNHALLKARRAIDSSELGQRPIAAFSSIQQQFDFIETPTPLQQYAESVPLENSPQLFLLEDVTGAGKTEAAMVLIHRLMAQRLANGVYVGLPTMATANAMYERMAKSYKSLYAAESRPSLVLAHGARKLSKAFQDSIFLPEQDQDSNYDQEDFSASAYCNQWLADNQKKALLADVGVGTIDQALLGVLPARHQSLRLLGLSNKVLLVDEVHAFDPYMRKLLATLLHAHASQGGSAIMLSATLPFKFRKELVGAYAEGAGIEVSDPVAVDLYPLVTQIGAAGLVETPVETRASVRRNVFVERLDSNERAFERIRKGLDQGRCVCWIRNTVKDARDAYQKLAGYQWIDQDKLTLFHSRYAMVDRQKIELDVLSRFGKNSSACDRSGQVLIATQVVEQSLDLDFDVMISDLAPIDLIIQRAGRLQRHVRTADGNIGAKEATEQRGKPVLYLLAPNPSQVDDKKWLREFLPGTQAVYPHVGQLWLTVRALLQNNGFTMPEDARVLIEGVYGDIAQDDIPQVLEELADQAMAEQRAQRGMGDFNCLKLARGYTRSSAGQSGGWDEDIHIPTRLGADSVTIALAKPVGEELVPYSGCGSQSWAMSQLSIPKNDWQDAQKMLPDRIKGAIEQLKKDTPALRWVEILPLAVETEHLYSAVGGWDISGG